jgi:glutamine amidotransferase
MNPDKRYVAIVDYGMGNLFSIMNICRHVELDAVKTSKKEVIDNAAAVVLPGVGAFGDAIAALSRLDLIDAVKDAANSGKPFMGICLGMQLLMSESEEFGKHKGLNILPGRVIKFPNINNKNELIRVPHIGWNKVSFTPHAGVDRALLGDISNNAFMYFVHSFFVVPQREEVVIAYTDYCGIRFCSVLQRDNLIAFQFHPEKSGPLGIQIFKNFKEFIFKER